MTTYLLVRDLFEQFGAIAIDDIHQPVGTAESEMVEASGYGISSPMCPKDCYIQAVASPNEIRYYLVSPN